MRVPGKEPMETPAQVKVWLQQAASDIKATKALKGEKTDRLDTTIVIRAHADADFAKVYGVMRLAKDTGFTKLQLRAIMQNQQPG